MATFGNKGPNQGALEKLKLSSSSLPPIKSAALKSPPNYLSPTSRIRIAGSNHRYSTSDDDSGCVMDEYAWVPSGLKPDIVHQYFSCIPEDRIPYVNSPGEKWRNYQLQYQLPPQDSDARFCGNLSESEETSLQWFDEARRQECVGRGVVSCVPFDNNSRFCQQCKEKVTAGEIIVMAPERFPEDFIWHPQCFTCEKCNELLVDLIYFQDKNSVYCGRHHAERHKHRCAHCDELIFCDEYTEAEGRNWHLKHFICNRCDCQLGGQNYMVTSGLHYCMNCYHLASRCNTCRKYIIADKPHVTQGNIHWHADERCFCCAICERNLLGKKRYTFIDGMLLCGTETCARSHELRRQPLQPSSSSQKFCHLQRAGSLSSVPPGSSSPSMGSLTPSGSASPAHSDRPISRRKEYLQSLPPVQKSPSRVRFDLRPQQPILGSTMIPEQKSRPKPPPSNPPPPPPNIPNALTPPENIYETVIMPSQISSSSSQEFNRSYNIKRSKRRSKRKTAATATPNNHSIGEENNDYIVSSDSSDSDNPTDRLPSSSTGTSSKYRSINVCSPTRSSSADCRYRSSEVSSRSCHRNNHYSNPPPDGCEKRCNSCSSSSSESDGDDVYLSHYLAASLSRPENLKAQNKGKMSPFVCKKQRHRAIPTIATPKTAKNKKSSNSNCIVS